MEENIVELSINILQKRPFAHNFGGFVRNFGWVFEVLFEVLLIEIQVLEEIHHFAGWEGGGFKGYENCEQKCFEQTAVSYILHQRHLKGDWNNNSHRTAQNLM